jgi:hypothetical protein
MRLAMVSKGPLRWAKDRPTLIFEVLHLPETEFFLVEWYLLLRWRLRVRVSILILMVIVLLHDSAGDIAPLWNVLTPPKDLILCDKELVLVPFIT